MYALAVNGRIQNVDGCWYVNAPTEIIVLQDGVRFSSITYRTPLTREQIASFHFSEAEKQRLYADPWTPWYSSQAWVFSQWLRSER